MISMLLTAPSKARMLGSKCSCREIAPRGRTLASISGQANDRWEYDHDVLVVGGGIVGCSLACRLAQGTTGGGFTAAGVGHGVAKPPIGLIEMRPPQPLETALSREGHDPRVYALTPSSAKLLDRIGVWRAEKEQQGTRDKVTSQRELGIVMERSQAFGSMQVWDDRGPGHIRFGGKRTTPLGFITEHGVLHSALFEKVKQFENVGRMELTCPAQVKRVGFPTEGAGGSRGPVRVTVETQDGETRDVTCRLLVAADGGDSKVAKILGLTSWGWGYGQRAVVATVRLAESHMGTAFQRYLTRGPLAMLPLGDNHASLVWSTTPEHAEHLKALAAEDFVAEVNDALRLPPGTGTRGERSEERSNFTASGAPASTFRNSGNGSIIPGFDDWVSKFPPFQLGGLPTAPNPFTIAQALMDGAVRGIEGISGALAGLSSGLEGEGDSKFVVPPEAVEVTTPRLGFDLSLRQAHRYTGNRVALVGDAAHTVHPMAGQGLNLGLADVDALTSAVLEGRRSGTDVGSETLLARYEEERKMDALVMMGALDSLHRLFGADARAVAAVRNAGLSALNLAGPIKERIALHAMGGKGAGK